mgnify:CR=1 FL=1
MNENYAESWIGIEEAAKHLGVTKDTIRNWIKKTDIPACKIGKLWKFKRSECRFQCPLRRPDGGLYRKLRRADSGCTENLVMKKHPRNQNVIINSIA